MEGYFQAAAGVLIAAVLTLTLGNQNKSFSILLTMGICAMVLLLGLKYLEPVSDFILELESLGNLPGEMVKILMKTAFICMLTEISALLCADSGNASTAQALRIVGALVILWLSLPVFRGLLELVQKILGGI